MTDIDFKALLIGLKEKKDRCKDLTAEETFLLNHRIHMDALRQEAAKREKMKSLVKDVDSTLRFPNDFVLTADTVVGFRIDPDSLDMTYVDSVEDLIFDSTGKQSVVFFGQAGKGKTPIAEACASLQSYRHDKKCFVATNTADSLRRLLDFDLLENDMGVVLDEYKNRGKECGSQGGGTDHLKNLLDPSDAKTIQARFNDFTLGNNMPRFVTCQDLGKLMPEMSNFTSSSSRWNYLRTIITADERAIIKRCVFIEVIEHVVKPEMRLARSVEVADKSRGLKEAAARRTAK